MATPTQRVSRPALKVLGPLELDILRILWKRGASTAREVHETLAVERDLAYTTVAKVLDNLTAKGLVRKEPVSPAPRGRCPHAYTPLFDEQALVLWFMKDLARDVGLDAAQQRAIGRSLLGEAPAAP